MTGILGALMVVPFILFHKVVMWSETFLHPIHTGMALSLMLPFIKTYDYPSTYKQFFYERQAIVACVRRYIYSNGNGICLIPERVDIGNHIDYAKHIRLLYTQRR